MKVFGNGELKLTLRSTAGNYRKLRRTFNGTTCAPDHDKKELSIIRFFTIFIRGLDHSTDLIGIRSELLSVGHELLATS